MIPHILSIAGSDPSGGAGVQADLKTFSALGCYGMAAITALTAQNTRGVTDVFMVPPDFLRAQIDTIFSDIRVDALKIGMAGTADSIAVLEGALKRHRPPVIVLDPVMVATSGDRLLPDAAIARMRESMLPLADCITPNIPEAEVLLGQSLERDFGGDLGAMASALLDLGARSVLLKGGHLSGESAIDIYCSHTEREPTILETKRIVTKNTHGTGCTLSSALACFLARGLEGAAAARVAKDYLTQALGSADQLQIGGGHGPVHHFHTLWESA
ncbi:MAG: bifunctional hydroxymethylpyrimidine kinase/phosphomethylpyrimidine kinase [Alphaproteobacteria bacterium]